MDGLRFSIDLPNELERTVTTSPRVLEFQSAHGHVSGIVVRVELLERTPGNASAETSKGYERRGWWVATRDLGGADYVVSARNPNGSALEVTQERAIGSVMLACRTTIQTGNEKLQLPSIDQKVRFAESVCSSLRALGSASITSGAAP